MWSKADIEAVRARRWSKNEIEAARALVGRFVNDLSKIQSELVETLRSKGLLDTEWDFRGSMVQWTCEALTCKDVREVPDGPQ